MKSKAKMATLECMVNLRKRVLLHNPLASRTTRALNKDQPHNTIQARVMHSQQEVVKQVIVRMLGRAGKIKRAMKKASYQPA